MKKQTIYFRADGNTKIGLGHIIRSLALADMLKSDFDCIFLCQKPSKSIQKGIIKPISLKIIPKTDDYLEEAKMISEKFFTKNDIVVLDGYHFGTTYQKEIKASVSKLVCIDDIHNYHFVADVVINHASKNIKKAYSADPYTKFCCGIDYALLRKPFLNASLQNRNITKIENIFICFGGSDLGNISKKILDICVTIPKIKRICIVLGSAYEHKDEFLSKKDKEVEIHYNLSAQKMLDLMQTCELAIVPASSISIEVLAAKLFILTGITADNQNNIHDELIKYDFVSSVGNFEKCSKNKIEKGVFDILEKVKQKDKAINFIQINSRENLKSLFKNL